MDCLPELDGDLCLLDVSCNTEEVPYVCEPAAVAECEPTLSICADNTCLPETGKCEVFPVLEGMDCDEPVNCVVAGTCTNGVCIGTPITCADENPCTSDVCEAGTGCVFTPQIIPCDDDDPCTINDFCTAGGVCLGSETGCEEPGSLVMRLTSLHFNAPGFCLPGPDDTCQDASALVNSFVAADLADPDSPLIMLAAFTPFDLAGDSSLFSLGPGECSADLNGENVCSFTYEPSKLSPVSFTSSGACTGPGDTTVDAPCFAVSGPAVDLGIMDIVFTVGDASVTGTFDGMPAPGSITDGHLEAFLSLEVAQLITVTLPLMPSYKLNQLLNPDEFVTQNGIPGWPIKAVFDAGYVTSAE
jgi:hypothetical protein